MKIEGDYGVEYDTSIFKKLGSFAAQEGSHDNIIAIPKIMWSIRIAQKYRFHTGLDLFGGVGHSAYIMAQACDKVIVVEKEKEKADLIKKNLARVKTKNVEIVNQDNLQFLAELSKRDRFDWIDFDPYADCLLQLEYLPKIFNTGVVCISSGSITMVTRNFPGRHKMAY